jgi:hypothetical protein
MVHLPPKDKEEDQAHLERWKNMMEESRSAGTCDPFAFSASSESVSLGFSVIDNQVTDLGTPHLRRTKTPLRRCPPRL